GNTPYEVIECSVDIQDRTMLPLSVLGDLRKQMVQAVDSIRSTTSQRQIRPHGVSKALLASVKKNPQSSYSNKEQEQTLGATPRLRVLCRTLTQLDALLEAGARDLAVEFHDIREYRQAVERAHRVGAKIYLTTLRILKEGESGLFKALHKHPADGWLVRNLA
ncbi:MAG: DUF3656 domain-containing protein, partial [Pirellula sp.]